MATIPVPTGTTSVTPDDNWSMLQELEQPSVVVPAQILERYISVALDSAVLRELDGEWYADLPRFPGVWATGTSAKKCLDSLQEVLREWLLLKIADQDRDIPVVDNIDLAVSS